jgi:predicted ATPase/DNA-binding CsgD family transcriptional regulator/transcriptional regulator with XRE-family HTH domain
MAASETGFGDVLRTLRVRAGLSQAALAERANLSAAAVAALERGRRSAPYPRTIDVLSEALGLSARDRAELAAAAPRHATRAQPAVATSPPSRLPSLRTGLIGRERELTRVSSLLAGASDGARLVTLTGAGGIGKTSLALHIAHSTRGDFDGGVWLVELAAITEPCNVDRAVAETLEAVDSSSETPVDAVCRLLLDKQALLVLDNCEHVLEGCARLVDTLLDRCEHLRILTTSREPLLLHGEQQLRLAPLPFQTVSATSGGTQAHSPALQLFVARAQSVVAEFELTQTNIATVAELCARLDGIPLAIELAAARIRTLSPEQILARLEDTDGLLSNANRTAPTRHQTLGAAIDWSYALLSDRERAAFRRLSVFVGEFDLEAAEAVCGAVDLGQEHVLDVLTSLIDKSLIVASSGAEHIVRYRLLEPIRHDALRRLSAEGDEARVRDRHGALFSARAREAAPHLVGSEQAMWLKRVEEDLANYRSAIRWLNGSRDKARLKAMVLDMMPVWEVHGHLAEGLGYLEQLLATVPTDSTERAQILLGIGRLGFWHVQLAHAAASLNEARTLATRHGDEELDAQAETWLGAVRRREGRYEESTALLEASLAKHEARGTATSAAWATFNLACIADLPRGSARSVRLMEDALQRYRALGNTRFVAMVSILLAADLVDVGQPERVPRLVNDALGWLAALGDRTYLATGLVTVAYTFAQIRQPLRAARLLGAAEVQRAAIGAMLPPNTLITYDQTLESIGDQLSPHAVREALAAGRAMTLEDALIEARVSLSPSAPAKPDLSLQESRALTERERQVVVFLTRGLSDQQIAHELGMSLRTANAHVRNVLSKLELRSRWQVRDRALTNSLNTDC